jgi:hypothetical protein
MSKLPSPSAATDEVSEERLKDLIRVAEGRVENARILGLQVIAQELRNDALAALRELQRRRAVESDGEWVAWKRGDGGPPKVWYWTTQDDGVATVCERCANGWRSAAWKVIAYWSCPLPPPYDPASALEAAAKGAQGEDGGWK